MKASLLYLKGRCFSINLNVGPRLCPSYKFWPHCVFDTLALNQVWHLKVTAEASVTSPAQVNMVSIGTVAAEIQLASTDNVLATQAKATLIAPSGV